MLTFPMHSNIYLIPPWISDALKRHKLQLVDLLDIRKMRRILSMNDLLAVEALQTFNQHVFGCEAGSGSLMYEWLVSAADRKDDVSFVNTVLTPLAKEKAQHDTIKERLFSGVATSDKEQSFEIVPLDTRGIGVVIAPGFFSTGNLGERQFALIRAVLKQLYVYEKQSVVASLTLYLKYLELLSVQRH